MTMSETIEAIEPSYILTSLDRCDSCSAEALVLVKLVTGELQFCGHHYNRYANKLSSYAYEIVDERSKINPKPIGAY
jgi:hypothetical protein